MTRGFRPSGRNINGTRKIRQDAHGRLSVQRSHKNTALLTLDGVKKTSAGKELGKQEEVGSLGANYQCRNASSGCHAEDTPGAGAKQDDTVATPGSPAGECGIAHR